MRVPTRPALGLLLVLLLTMSGCGELTPAATQTPPPPTATPAPSSTPPPPPTATRPPVATSPAEPTAAPPTETAETSPTPPEPSATPAPSGVPSDTPIPTEAATAIPEPTATPEIVLSPLGELPNLLDQEVTVQATIIWASSFSQGFKFLLDDGSGRATLLMWLNVYDDCWDASQLMVGATVRAHGTVGQYEGEWQVEAGYGGDVKVLSPGAPPPLRQIATLTTDDLTTRVTIEGTVASAEAFSSGQRVYLDDGTGTILVLLWQNVFERVPDGDRLITPGTPVRMSGVVEEYQGTLELVPQLPYSVVVL